MPSHLLSSKMAGQDASQEHRREEWATERPFITSSTAKRLNLMANQRFLWMVDRDVMIVGLFTGCLFLLCREIKQSKCLADPNLDLASITRALLHVTYDVFDTIWHLIKKHEA
jgi:hypothetical protein